VRFNTCRIDEKRLFRPAYSIPIFLIRTVRIKNGKNIVKILLNIPLYIFLTAFFVRESFILGFNVSCSDN
ncbi:MAG: hypothetical protein SOT15_01225, partial [Treponema sp.]|nr:hypothetical protein [Treponema sp.]